MVQKIHIIAAMLDPRWRRGHGPSPRQELLKAQWSERPRWGWARRGWLCAVPRKRCWENFTGGNRKLQKPKVKTRTWREPAGLEEENRKKGKLIETMWIEIRFIATCSLIQCLPGQAVYLKLHLFKKKTICEVTRNFFFFFSGKVHFD